MPASIPRLPGSIPQGAAVSRRPPGRPLRSRKAGMRMRARIFISLLAATAITSGLAEAALKVHLYSPWAADPARQSPPAVIMIQGKDPGYYPGTQMAAEGGDWCVYTFKDPAPAANDNFKFVNY